MSGDIKISPGRPDLITGWATLQLDGTLVVELDAAALRALDGQPTNTPSRCRIIMRGTAGRRPSYTDEQIREAKAKRQAGAPWKDAAASIGMSESALVKRIKRLSCNGGQGA